MAKTPRAKAKKLTGTIKQCSYCGADVYFKKCRVRSSPQYCNVVCRNNHQKTNNELNCIICATSFYCSKSQEKYRNRKTCSLRCRGMMMIRIAEERNRLNPPTKGVLNRRIRYSKKMEDWRKAVFERDNYTCAECGARNGNGKAVYLEADHIKPFAYFEELRFELSNGQTLCKPCHKQTNTYGRRVVKLYAEA